MTKVYRLDRKTRLVSLPKWWVDMATEKGFTKVKLTIDADKIIIEATNEKAD